jgi:radical SAM superfamily enzyme YgiQ (UPF0313 family)
MGAESGSQVVLDAMDKGLNPQHVIRARERLRAAGIRACYFLQFGYPGERWHELQQTIELVRSSRPDDIGVSFSYPLPNTRFHSMVEQQMGRKRNWVDSDDLCVIFKGAYTDRFYRAVRDALHCEVDSWRGASSGTEVKQHWDAVNELEPISRNSEPTELSSSVIREFVRIEDLQPHRREA